MKHTLLFLALYFFGNSSFGQYSDLKDYGLKGNVKSIDNAYYKDVKPTGKKWKVDSTDTAFLCKSMHFNRSGQIDTIRATNYYKKDSTYNSMVVFDLENDRKAGFSHYNFKNELTDYTDIEWLDDRTYKFVVTDLKEDVIYESTSWLSVEFQDSAGHTVMYENGVIVDTEKYINRLDKSRRVVVIDYFDEFNKPTNSQTVEYQEFDKHGNWTLAIVKDTFTGKLIKLTVRTLEYY